MGPDQNSPYGAAQPIMDIPQKINRGVNDASSAVDQKANAVKQWMAQYLNRLKQGIGGGQQPQPGQQQPQVPANGQPAQAAPGAMRPQSQQPGLASQAVQALRNRYAQRMRPTGTPVAPVNPQAGR